MRFNLDSAMGMHEQALYVRAKRTSLIASNLANSDTPEYKARDIDFRSILKQVAGSDDATSMKRTQSGHMAPIGSSSQDAELLYRYPHQASIDGNTVDADMEKSQFAENTVRYQTTMHFLSSRIKGLKSAIKGESA